MSECSVNFATFLLHSAFTFITVVVLICNKCYVARDSISPYLSRWVGHSYRWTLLSLVMLCAIASLGEGILTDWLRLDTGEAQLQFYLPSSLAFLASFMSLVYYQHAEKWRAPRMLWLLLGYWLCCIAVYGLRIGLLFQENVDTSVMVLWISLVTTAFYFIMLILEVYVIVTKVIVYTNVPLI